MFYLMTHSTHFIYGYMASDYMVNDHSDSERENLLPFNRQDSTYHGLCYTSHGALAGMYIYACHINVLKSL